MNRYPLWKYAIIAVALLVGVFYTLPNFFGEAPAVQISSAKATVKIDSAVLARVQQARARHQVLLARRFPQLGQVPLEHTWMGWLGISRNHAPLFGRLSPNLFAAACCNGVGIVRHTAAGAAIADLACGGDSDVLRGYQAQDQAALLPPRPWLDAGVRARLWWEAFAGRQER